MSDRIQELLASWNAGEIEDGVPPEDRSFARGGDPGAPALLLIHGGGGRPSDLRPLAEALAPHPSLCPLLPCHGRGDQALGALRFDMLLARAAGALDALKDGGRSPVLVGQSLGAVVGTCLAADRSVRGFVALAPAFRPHTLRRIRELVVNAIVAPARTLGSYRWQMEARRAIRETAARIPDVRCPLLVLHSRDDPTVSPRGGRDLYEQASSADKRFIELQDQGHVLSCAPDLESVAAPIREFLAAR